MKIGDRQQCPQQKKRIRHYSEGKYESSTDAPAFGPACTILFPLQRRDIHLGLDVYSFQYTEKGPSCLLYYSAVRIKPDMFNISHCKGFILGRSLPV